MTRRRNGFLRVTTLTAAAAAISLSACGSSGSSTSADSSASQTKGAASSQPVTSADAAQDAAAATSTSAPARQRSANLPSVTVALAGDANTAWTARRVLRDGVGPIFDTLRKADVAVLTLETLVVADRTGLVREPKAFNFVTGPALVDRLADAGVDVVNAANNHTMDYKVEGMRRMLDLKLPVGVVGIGADRDAASKPWIKDVRGRKVVVFGANDVITDGLDWEARPGHPGQATLDKPERLKRLVDDVKAARAADPDAVIVTFLHWGLEPMECPTQRQRDIAQQLADAGADIVGGSHSHRQQPYTTIKAADGHTTAVAYGLGNFVFNAKSEPTGRTGVLTVTVPGSGAPTADWTPARIRDGIPAPLSGSARDAAIQKWKNAGNVCS